MTEPRTYHGGALPYNPLSDVDVQKIINAVFHLLRETGVKFDPVPRAIELFTGAGCEVLPDGIVKFPTELVRSAIESVGKKVRLWDRPGSGFIEFGSGHTIFMAGVTCPNIVDLESGEQRPTTKEDLVTITRVADKLPDIDGVCLPCKIMDMPNVSGEIEEFATLAANTTKPLTYLCESETAFRAAIEMAAAIRGGPDRLAEKPYFCFMVTPLHMYYARQHIEHIFLAVDNGIPMFPCATMIGGASAPITIAGNLVNCLATDFACIVLTQLIKQGSFCAPASVCCFMDPRSGNFGGIAEMPLAELARCQIAQSLGLPRAGGLAGSCFGKQFNQLSASSATASMMYAAFSQPGYCWCAGAIDSVQAFSLHALLFCHELVGCIRRIWRGITVDDETLALDVTHKVGPGGDFLAEMHSATHCRTELWISKYFRTTWDESNASDLTDMIDKDLHEILETHRPEPLDKSIQDQIGAIQRKFGVV